jgi:hypothetical protein
MNYMRVVERFIGVKMKSLNHCPKPQTLHYRYKYKIFMYTYRHKAKNCEEWKTNRNWRKLSGGQEHREYKSKLGG